ncbi:MAG: hypothetical protein Q4F13_15625 [Pseudomonadota bacterium]|nr:hypothetical protein [Pseudomonadota bacterium]
MAKTPATYGFHKPVPNSRLLPTPLITRRTLCLIAPMTMVAWLAGCQPQAMIDIAQNLPPGLHQQPWGNSQPGEAFYRHLLPVVRRVSQEMGAPLRTTLELQTPAHTDMAAISAHYAQALGTGWQRSDTALHALTATVWQHQRQALLLAFTREVFDFGSATPSRLVFLAATPAS